jgi:hypothetical protein
MTSRRVRALVLTSVTSAPGMTVSWLGTRAVSATVIRLTALGPLNREAALLGRDTDLAAAGRAGRSCSSRPTISTIESGAMERRIQHRNAASHEPRSFAEVSMEPLLSHEVPESSRNWSRRRPPVLVKQTDRATILRKYQSVIVMYGGMIWVYHDKRRLGDNYSKFLAV